jgi:hypothetical protein
VRERLVLSQQARDRVARGGAERIRREVERLEPPPGVALQCREQGEAARRAESVGGEGEGGEGGVGGEGLGEGEAGGVGEGARAQVEGEERRVEREAC